MSYDPVKKAAREMGVSEESVRELLDLGYSLSEIMGYEDPDDFYHGDFLGSQWTGDID